MGVLHLLQGVLMLSLASNFVVNITTSYLHPTLSGIPTTITENIFSVSVGPLVALFLFISAFAHFTLCTSGARNWYLSNLEKKINYARWVEYALSSSVMIVIIALLSGMFDFPSLILLFSINAFMNLCGLIMEKYNQNNAKPDWTAFVVGCFAGIVPWIVICMYFFGAASRADNLIPTFVYFILLSLFVFFNIFAINMYLQYKKVGPWKDYIFGEKMYIVLSLVAKSLLAWQVFFGALRRG